MNSMEKYKIASYIRNSQTRLGICIMKNNGESDGYQQYLKFNSACCIKSFIMIEYLRQLEANHISGREQLIYSKNNYTEGPGKIKYMPFGTAFSIDSLAEFMIARSDHIAANMLIDFFDLSEINHTIADFGFPHTILYHKFYLHTLQHVGETTPYELALLYKRINNGELISPEKSELIKKILLKQKFKDILTDEIVKNDSKNYVDVASKSGKLDGRQYNSPVDSCLGDGGIVFTRHGSYSIALIAEIPVGSSENVETVKLILQKISFNIFKRMVDEL